MALRDFMTRISPQLIDCKWINVHSREGRGVCNNSRCPARS
jgi:hypothetical protein